MFKNKTSPTLVWLYPMVIIISIGLSLLAYYQDPIFNVDGLRYLQAADAYWLHGFHAAMTINSWPFYSLVIAYVSKLTGLSSVSAAFLMNILFSMGIVVLFIKLIEEMDPSPKIAWLAAFVILICHQFNSYRYFFIRDHGYWFFYLLSALFLIRFCRGNDRRWLNAFGWSISLAISALFRLEGSVFLVLMPFCVWILPELSWKKRLQLYLQLNIPLVIYGMGALGAAWHLHIHKAASIGRLYDLYDRPKQMLNRLPDIQARLLAIRQFVLIIPEARRDAGDFFLFGMLGTFLKSIFGVYTLTFTFLTMYAVWKRLILDKISNRVLFSYWLVNFFVLTFFYAQMLFLASRYVMAISFIMLCFVPFALKDLYQSWKKRPRGRVTVYSVLFPIIALLLLAMIVSDLHRFGHSKSHLYRAAAWVRHNTPASAHVCIDEGLLEYLTQRKIVNLNLRSGPENLLDSTKIKLAPWHACDYAVVSFRDNENVDAKKMAAQANLASIIEFTGNHGQDKTIVFKVSISDR